MTTGCGCGADRAIARTHACTLILTLSRPKAEVLEYTALPNTNKNSHDNVYGAVCYIVIILFVWFVQEKMNVHLYFDKDQGSWVRLPLAWELYSDFVKELMATIRVMRPFHFRLRPIH